jgi:hypothetical protein
MQPPLYRKLVDAPGGYSFFETYGRGNSEVFYGVDGAQAYRVCVEHFRQKILHMDCVDLAGMPFGAVLLRERQPQDIFETYWQLQPPGTKSVCIHIMSALVP